MVITIPLFSFHEQDLVEGILFGNTPEVQVRCVRLVGFLLRQANSLSSVEMALARVFQAVQTKRSL